MLRDGEGAATGDKGHEERSANVAGLGELLATADVVVAVSVHESVRQVVGSCPFPFHPSKKENAPGVTREVEPVSEIPIINLQLWWQITKTILRHRQVPVKASVTCGGGNWSSCA